MRRALRLAAGLGALACTPAVATAQGAAPVTGPSDGAPVATQPAAPAPTPPVVQPVATQAPTPAPQPSPAPPAPPPPTPSAPSAQAAPRPMPPMTATPPVSDSVIDDRIRASASAAQSYQGRLDGAWILVAAADSKPIFAFQLVEKPGGAPPEGVWRDLRRAPVPGDINFVDTLERGPQTLSMAFARPGGPKVDIELKSDAAGAWSGELMEAGVITRVRLRRG